MNFQCDRSDSVIRIGSVVVVALISTNWLRRFQKLNQSTIEAGVSSRSGSECTECAKV